MNETKKLPTVRVPTDAKSGGGAGFACGPV